MSIKDTDKFVIVDPTDGQHYSVGFDTLKTAVVPEHAQYYDPADNKPGRVGLMKPTRAFDYDEATGILDIIIPTSLHFVDLITVDNQEPKQNYNHQTGDFYYVEPDVGDSVSINPDDWPGLDNAEFDFSVTSGGSGYRANIGTYQSFGLPGNTYQETVVNTNTNNTQSKEVIFDLIIDGGFIIAASVITPGDGYNQGDILKITNDTSEEPGYIRVETVNPLDSGILTVVLCDKYGYISEFTGRGFEIPDALGYIGKRLALPTSEPATYVDVEINAGQVVDASYNISSQHAVKDQLLDVYNKDGQHKGCVIQVTLASATQPITLKKGDKLVLDKNGVWHVIGSVSSDKSIYDLVGEPINSSENFNNQLAIDTRRDTSLDKNKVYLKIKDAYFELDANNDVINTTSYSGFFTPEEKYKLETIAENADPGLIRYLTTNQLYDIYDGSQYVNIVFDVTDSIDVVGGYDYEIILKTASEGRRGVTIISSDSAVQSSINREHIGIGSKSSEEVVCSSRQISEFYTPLNYYILPELT